MPHAGKSTSTAPTAGLPTVAGRSRRVQVLVSLGAGWVALHLPPLYNILLLPMARGLLGLVSFLRGPSYVDAQSPAGFRGGLQGLVNRVLGTVVDALSGLPGEQPVLPPAPGGEDGVPVRLGDRVQPYLDAGLPPPMPECWGHRGASGVFPENTLPSFERAIQDGSEGIETDVHITLDDVILIFHDPALERTTDGSGLIQEQNWHGAVELVRTRDEPRQQIPRFEQLCDLMMQPHCRHVKANIDIKPENDPERLFRLLGQLVRTYPDWQSALAPRILLGLWHPKFIPYALHYLPELTRVHIGGSPSIARQYFWPWVSGFSMHFDALLTAEGQVFFRDAKAAGKLLTVWTVNEPDEMIEAARWGVDAVLTDNTSLFHRLRQQLTRDFLATERAHVPRLWAWSNGHYYPSTLWSVQTTRLGLMEARARQPYGLTASQHALLHPSPARQSKSKT